jgi:hypothetical protein
MAWKIIYQPGVTYRLGDMVESGEMTEVEAQNTYNTLRNEAIRLGHRCVRDVRNGKIIELRVGEMPPDSSVRRALALKHWSTGCIA